MKPANAVHLYLVRLRARLPQECLAALGIAAGVALLFASQVSSASLQSSVAQLSHGIAGKATLQLVARDPNGFPQSLLGQVRRIPGVSRAAPLLEANANAIGPRGSESVELIGADSTLARLGGALVRNTALAPFAGVGAIVLAPGLAKTVGVQRFGQELTLQLAGHTVRAPLYAQLQKKQVGQLTATPIALAPLFYAQEMTRLQARLTRILVQSAPGEQAQVRAALQAQAGKGVNVEPVGYEEKLFAKAAAASNQSTALFAAISALVGFLLAFNATLFTVSQRRKLIRELRREGYTPQTGIALLLLDALILGCTACTLGLLLGEALSIRLFQANPAFLSLAFTVGSARTVSWQSVAIATAGGMGAALTAVLSPLYTIRPQGSQHARAKLKGGGWALASLASLVGATILLRAAPQDALPSMVLLVGALLCVLPLVLNATLALVRRLARTITSAIPHVAAMELGSARTRALAISATGAIAVFGSVAIEGAHRDLLAGLDRAAGEVNAFTNIWVSPAGSYNLLQTTAFSASDQAKLQRLPGVRAVEPYRSGLLDYGERRTLVIAPARAANPLLPAGQLLQGNPQKATQQVRAGGWLVLSQAIAQEHHLHIGQAFKLPTPNPKTFRLAALSTNIGWAPGAILMNASDYAKAWDSPDISAYTILLTPQAEQDQVISEIRQALGPSTGLAVQSAEQHTSQQRALNRQALARLTQIATLIPIVAILAMAAAIGAMIWQRRPRLAKLKLEGFPRLDLWCTLLLESLLLLGVGCLTGALFGLYGQQLADRVLANAVNFPVEHSLTLLLALRSLTLIIAAALAVLAIPGYLAASVPATLVPQD